jgi:FlaA1/EpsC-like NDP-sugar epimerase
MTSLSPDELSHLATGRSTPLFEQDLEMRRELIRGELMGRRALVIGAAGSIGSSTTCLLAGFNPRALHLVDHNENGLTELMRDLRSGQLDLAGIDLRTLPIDFGSPVMERFLLDQEPYDYVLNFAALKHVRSEKDVYSLAAMLDTNIEKPARLMQWLKRMGIRRAYFSVSTDKAANPVNLMGASKRLMEHLLFSDEFGGGLGVRVSSARFANVAFSDGSLLYGFLRRMEKRQPLAVPAATRRFFVSLHEAGIICLLACVCAPHNCLLIPRMCAEKDLRDLQAIASGLVELCGMSPRFFADEDEAREAVKTLLPQKVYPVLVTPLDTSGEKPFEEFIGDGEEALDLGFHDLLGVSVRAPAKGALPQFLEFFSRIMSEPGTPVTKGQLLGEIQRVVPELHHIETGKSLDGRM